MNKHFQTVDNNQKKIETNSNVNNKLQDHHKTTQTFSLLRQRTNFLIQQAILLSI